MDNKLQDQLFSLGEKIIAYLPNFFAGIALVAVGWLLGWLAKRVIMQVALIFRLERFLTSFRWGQDFSRADVRFGFYNFLGNISFLIIFLVFLDNALSAWKLTVLSNLIERGIYLFPRIAIALIIFGLGWLLSTWTTRTLRRSLRRERVPRATLIARFANAVLLLLFSAMALVELNVAREIVIIGFATIIITMGALTIVITAIGGKDLVKSIQETLEGE